MNPLTPAIKQLTPAEIVAELDKYVIGQDAAKRAVAIALRNRWRRQQVVGELREEIYPNNIILIGPTGVGKTELARRLANLAGAPFIKVEASKYTEVGYVGRDVESMIRDLADTAVAKVKFEQRDVMREVIEHAVEERLIDVLLPAPRRRRRAEDDSDLLRRTRRAELERHRRKREDMRERLLSGELEHETVELDVPEDQMPLMQIFSAQGIEEMGINMPEMAGGPAKRTRRRMVTVAEAREIVFEEEIEQQIDMDRVIREALRRTETAGIVFLDEIDKVAAPADALESSGPDVSRSGVQRDILPVIEGTTVTTKYGHVRTDHILFIAAGAFSTVKPSDLIPELQGRFPIRVELDKLGAPEFLRILTEPRNALVKQYTAMLATEGVDLTFTRDALREIAELAHKVNQKTEDIGARRLHTMMTTLLDDILFDAPFVKRSKISITKTRVAKMLAAIAEDEDLSRFIL